MPYHFPYKRTVTLTSKGQITLPVELRRSWNLKKGDQLDFTLHKDGSVHVRKFIRLSNQNAMMNPTSESQSP